MFRVKICGIRKPVDGLIAAEAGAEAVGLNFYPKSPRYIFPEQAQQIVRLLPPHVIKVGLFVNAAVAEVRATFDRLRLDLVQLHGDEPPEYLVKLEHRPVIKAFRLNSPDMQELDMFLDRCGELDCLPRMVLVDASVPDLYGGTGQKADWDALIKSRGLLGDRPLVLAGGLTPDNVQEAIGRVKPDAVDTASGVEIAPAEKDAELIRRFVENAIEALERLD